MKALNRQCFPTLESCSKEITESKADYLFILRQPQMPTRTEQVLQAIDNMVENESKTGPNTAVCLRLTKTQN
jgi:hypothetical protein